METGPTLRMSPARPSSAPSDTAPLPPSDSGADGASFDGPGSDSASFDAPPSDAGDAGDAREAGDAGDAGDVLGDVDAALGDVVDAREGG